MLMQPTREIVPQHDGGVLVHVTPPSFMHLPRVSVKLSAEQYSRYVQWRNGSGQIQDMLPDLTVDQREMLMSGIGDGDWNRLFSDND